MTKFYWTLKDMIEHASDIDLTAPWQDQWQYFWDTGKYKKYQGEASGAVYLTFKQLVKSYISLSDIDNEPYVCDEADKLLMRYIFPRFRDMYVGYTHTDTKADRAMLWEYFVKALVLVYNCTYEKYLKVINTYETEKNNLLKDVSIISESKYNDTPQNMQGTFSWADDDHLTNVSKNTVTTPIQDKVQKIKQIETALSHYYLEWSNEFRRLFIYE